jgi:hypothetical protein
MAAKFIRIPYGTRLSYPSECPFTGRQNPKSSVTIRNSRLQMFLPIPFIGLLIRRYKVGRLRFPASPVIMLGEMFLTLTSWTIVAGGLVAIVLFSRQNNDRAFFCTLIAWAVMPIVIRIVRWFWLSRVRIVRVGTTSLEVRFAAERYADEFARINELHAGSHRTKKRAAPVTVNDVR